MVIGCQHLELPRAIFRSSAVTTKQSLLTTRLYCSRMPVFFRRLWDTHLAAPLSPVSTYILMYKEGILTLPSKILI